MCWQIWYDQQNDLGRSNEKNGSTNVDNKGEENESARHRERESEREMNSDEKSRLKSKTVMKKPMSRGASNNHELSISFFLCICLSENTFLSDTHWISRTYHQREMSISHVIMAFLKESRGSFYPIWAASSLLLYWQLILLVSLNFLTLTSSQSSASWAHTFTAIGTSEYTSSNVSTNDFLAISLLVFCCAYTCRHKHAVYLSFIHSLLVFRLDYLNFLTRIGLCARAPVSNERRKTEANLLRTFLRVDSDSHRNSSARAHGRFLSSASRVDTPLQIQQKCRFHVRFDKELGLQQASRPAALEASFLLPTLLCFLLFFFLLLRHRRLFLLTRIFFFRFSSFSPPSLSVCLSVSLSLYYEHTTNASLGIDASLRRLMLLFFDDGDDSSGNVVRCRICWRSFSYFEQH